jgi:hypothetical protein
VLKVLYHNLEEGENTGGGGCLTCLRGSFRETGLSSGLGAAQSTGPFFKP